MDFDTNIEVERAISIYEIGLAANTINVGDSNESLRYVGLLPDQSFKLRYLGNTRAVRDSVYVNDVVDGIVKMAEASLEL